MKATDDIQRLNWRAQRQERRTRASWRKRYPIKDGEVEIRFYEADKTNPFAPGYGEFYAWDGERAIGWLNAGIPELERYADKVAFDIEVSPDFRRRGVATVLLQAVKAKLHKDPIPSSHGQGGNKQPSLDAQHLWRAVNRVAARFKSKTEVPKADGDGTTTVYEYSDRQVQHRNREKAKRVEKLRGSIDKLRKQYKSDLTSEDDQTRYTALAVALIDCTFERVGNDQSAKDGHFGVTGWQAKHVKLGDGKATISYVGKSGVKQEKTIEDKVVVSAIREALKGKSGTELLCSGEDCRVTSTGVNEYLKPFGVTAKDLRGFHANSEMQTRLKAVRSKGGKLPEDKKERESKLKEEFKAALEETAEAVGHESSTLKGQYLVPGLEEAYIKDGTVIVRLDKTAGSVLPFKTPPKRHTITIKGRKYVLSDWPGSFLGSMSEELSRDPEGPRLIQGPEPSRPFRFLWVYDTDKQTLGMWRVTDGNEKAFGLVRSYTSDILRLDRKGEINRVSYAEMRGIEQAMRRKEQAHVRMLSKWVKEIETDYQKTVNRVALELFNKAYRPRIEKRIQEVRSGISPFGFKSNPRLEEHGETRERQAVSWVVGEGLKSFTPEVVEDYLRQKGIDPDAPGRDTQAAYWAVGDIHQDFWTGLSKSRRKAGDSVKDNILQWLDGLGDPLTLYRAVYVDDPSQVRLTGLGRFWTAEQKKAHSPFGKLDRSGSTEVVIQAKVPRSAVDEGETVATMRRYPEEREVRLQAGAPVQVEGFWTGREFQQVRKPGKVASGTIPISINPTLAAKWKKDTATLLANVKRIKTYQEADRVREAWGVFRKRIEKVVFQFLNTEINNLKFQGRLDDNQVATINRILRSPAWSFVTESFPLRHPDDWWTKEKILSSFFAEREKWLRRIKRFAKFFFDALGELFEHLKWMYRPITDDSGGVTVSLQEKYQTEVEGFKATLQGYDENNPNHVKGLSALTAALRLYRDRAKRVLPWLVQQQLPLVLKFDCDLGEGGRYLNKQILVCPTNYSGNAREGVRVLAHEMGHHLYRHLSGKAQDFWSKAVRGNWGPIDLEGVYQVWPDNLKWAWELVEHLRDRDPDLSLQLEILEHAHGHRGPRPFSTKEELRGYIDSGNRTVVVPKNPITAYADKNPEESFCEALGMLVAFGPRAVHEIVVGWLREIVPNVRVASHGEAAKDVFVSGFFQRHPKLRKYKGIKVQAGGQGGRSGHGQASVQQGNIFLHAPFWDLTLDVQDFVFAHEIGHWILDAFGLGDFIREAEALGVDPWDTPNLPFAQHNMHEAFADSFASYFTDRDVQRRYPEWAALVEKVYGKTRKTAHPLVSRYVRAELHREAAFQEWLSWMAQPFKVILRHHRDFVYGPVDDTVDTIIKELAPKLVKSLREKEVDQEVDAFERGAREGWRDYYKGKKPDPPREEEQAEGYAWGFEHPEWNGRELPTWLRKHRIQISVATFGKRITEEVLILALKKAWHAINPVNTVKAMIAAVKKYGWKLGVGFVLFEIFEHFVLPSVLVALTGNKSLLTLAAIPIGEIIYAVVIRILGRAPKQLDKAEEEGHLDWYEDQYGPVKLANRLLSEGA